MFITPSFKKSLIVEQFLGNYLKFKIIADLNDYQKLAIRREGRYYHFVTSQRDYNLGQYKMEQLSPIPPKAMMKARRSKKRAILASLKWGEGWSRCSIYFVQDCSDWPCKIF